MSSTARGASRENLDFYPTPGWCVDLLLDALAPHFMWPNVQCLEPAAGDGAIVKRLLARGVQPGMAHAIEIDPGRATLLRAMLPYAWCADFLTMKNEGRYDLIITNPSFSLTLDFARVALAMAGDRGTVALLLRLNWLGSQERAAFHLAHPSDILLLQKRPEFKASMSCSAKKKGCEWRAMLPIEAERPRTCPACGAKTMCSTTDSIEYAWFVWGPGRGNRWQILPMPETKGP